MKILLKSGTIVDGKNVEPYVADIFINNEKIVKIATSISADLADKVIDCKGLFVAPGFIDAHSHNDFFIDREDSKQFFEPFIRQGITTQITGNCGFSPFGVGADSQHKDKVGGGLFHTGNPTSFAEFKKLTEGNLYANIVPLIGQGTTRSSINGYDPTPLTKKEIEEEMLLAEEAMKNGAFGGSYGLMYEPGIFAKTDELIEFAKIIKKYNGVLTVHPRACSKVALGYPLFSKPHIELALEEIVKIMEETKVQTVYSHLIFVGKTSWNSADTMLKRFKELRVKGYDISYDNYSFTYGASVITVILPPWYMALSKADKKKTSNMLKLKLMTYITKKALGLDFCDITVAYIGEGYRHYEGKTVAELAKIENLKNFEMYLKLVDLSNGQGRIYLDKYYNEEIIKKLMTDENSVFMTDAWVEEYGTQNGATFQGFTNFLDKSKKYNIPIQTVIHKMTGATAKRYRMKDRGELAEGNFADITVFDMANIVVDLSKPDFTPKGIDLVLINGQLVYENQTFFDKKAGKLLTR